MAGLPTYDRRTLLENTGVVRFTGAGAAYEMIADVAGGVARQLQAEAEERHVAEGATAGAAAAVVRDAEGRQTFQPLAESNAYARAYNKAGRAHYLAAFETDQRKAAVELTALHGNDPAAFEAAWKGRTDGALQVVPEPLRPDAQNILAQLGTQTGGGILLRKQAVDQRLAGDAIETKIAARAGDLANLAFTGGAGSAAYNRGLAEYKAALDEAVGARLMNPERAQLLLDATIDDGKALAIANQGVEVFKRSGAQAANKFLRDSVSDPAFSVAPERRERIINMAQARMGEMQAGRSVALAEINDKAQGLKTRADLGFEIPSGSFAELARQKRALGDEVGANNLEQAGVVAEFVQSYRAQPLAVINAAAGEAAVAAQGQTADETAALKADGLARLWATKARALQTDAWTYGANAHARMIGPVQSVNFLDPNTGVAGIRERVRQASLIEAREGVPVLPFAKAEIDKLSALIPKMTVDQKQSLMLTLGEGLRDRVGPIMQEIAKGPGTGAFIAAAGIASQDAAVSRRILQGVEVMANNKDALPEVNDERRRFIDDHLGDAFLTDNALARRVAIEGAMALYAADSATKGDSSKVLDESRMREALAQATGGILKRNGAKLIAPERGMSQSTFNDLVDGLQDTDLGPADARPLKSDGAPALLADIRDRGRLRSLADGRYLVEVGGFALQLPAGKVNEFGSREWILDLRQTPVRRPAVTIQFPG